MSSVAKAEPVKGNDPTPVNGFDFSDTIAFSDNPYPLADVFMLYQNLSNVTNGAQAPVKAIEFVLEWCVQEFNISVTNGTALTTRQGSTHNFTGGFGFMTGPAFNTTTNFVIGPMNQQNYNVDNSTHFILSNYLRKTLNGSVHQDTAGFYKTSDAAEVIFQQLNPDSVNKDLNGGIRNETGLAQIWQNIATSMTNT